MWDIVVDMKIILLFSLIGILMLSSLIIVLPEAFAERGNSVFQKISNFFDEPFLFLEKAAGGDGHKRPHNTDGQQKLKPFMSSWICQILLNDASKITDVDLNKNNLISGICKGTI